MIEQHVRSHKGGSPAAPTSDQHCLEDGREPSLPAATEQPAGRYSYRAFGIGISSTIALPGLAPGDGSVDLVIEPGRIDRAMPPPASDGRCVLVEGTMVYLHWAAAGTFALDRGERVIFERAPGALEESLQLCLSGPILGVALHQRGSLLLHASAAVIGDSAVAFIADSGCGKTTLAVALYLQGHTLLADDVVALTDQPHSGPLVQPAIPRMKVEPELIVALDLPAQAMQRFHPADLRRALVLDGRFATAAVPLRCIYVLAPGSRQGIEPITPAAAMLALIRHCYPLRLLGAAGTTRETFRAIERLAATTPVFRLSRQQDLAALPDLVRMVQSHYVG